jgi:hypothetical protein
MAESSDRRKIARMTVPWHLSGPGFELRLARIIDLSPDGARIEHLEPLREGISCAIDLPPALGRARLMGRVVWTGIRGAEQNLEGERRLHYQSGVAFIDVTPEQTAALGHALDMLKAANEIKDQRPST